MKVINEQAAATTPISQDRGMAGHFVVWTAFSIFSKFGHDCHVALPLSSWVMAAEVPVWEMACIPQEKPLPGCERLARPQAKDKGTDPWTW